MEYSVGDTIFCTLMLRARHNSSKGRYFVIRVHEKAQCVDVRYKTKEACLVMTYIIGIRMILTEKKLKWDTHLR